MCVIYEYELGIKLGIYSNFLSYSSFNRSFLDIVYVIPYFPLCQKAVVAQGEVNSLNRPAN